MIQSLIINREIKRALRARIQKEFLKVSLILAKFVRKFRVIRQARKKRREGIFETDLYYQPLDEN
jgi:hypothetical protein